MSNASIATESKEEMEEDEEEEEEIDEEQIEDYCGMLDRLGNFPEKVAINSLSMAAEDFSDSPTSASVIYDCIRTRLVDRATPGISSADRKLPLVYVLDSLMKNVKGVYIQIIQDDAEKWMPIVYDILGEAQKLKLKKVWKIWRDVGVLKDEEKWRRIGECFLKAEESSKQVVVEDKSKAAGIGKNLDGSLKIMPSLRKQMQLLLDEVQSTGVDELDKVSLERLADINPNLLQQIKEEAELVLREQKQPSKHVGNAFSSTNPSSNIMSSQNPDGSITQLSDWSKLKLNHLEKSHTIIASLQRHVRSVSQQTTVVKSEMDNTVHLYAAVSASAQILTDMLHQWKTQSEEVAGFGYGDGSNGMNATRKRRFSLVRREMFTTEGVKERNDAVIARLYEAGLPFVCSADGRRFGTQIELSKHLDTLFKKSQLEKTMERTEERGWYTAESSWMGASSAGNADDQNQSKTSDPLHPSADNAADDTPSASTTVIADETRDRCILCGINFDMFFDQEDGEWKYRNCTEKNVWKDGASADGDELDAMLAHVTCWEGLGSPEFLTADQILHAG